MCSHRQLLAVIAAAVALASCVPAGSAVYPAGLPFEEAVEQSYRAGRINRATYETAIHGPTISAPAPLPAVATAPPVSSAIEEIPLQAKGKSFYLPVRINGTITIPFLLDTGATALALPSDVASTLIRAGALREGDLLSDARVTLADGSTQVRPRVLIREIRVGNQTATNVAATINPAAAEPLLGQAFLSRFGSITLDYRRNMLVLNR